MIQNIIVTVNYISFGLQEHYERECSILLIFKNTNAMFEPINKCLINLSFN